MNIKELSLSNPITLTIFLLSSTGFSAFSGDMVVGDHHMNMKQLLKLEEPGKSVTESAMESMMDTIELMKKRMTPDQVEPMEMPEVAYP